MGLKSDGQKWGGAYSACKNGAGQQNKTSNKLNFKLVRRALPQALFIFICLLWFALFSPKSDHKSKKRPTFGPNKKYHFSAYYEKLQMQLVLLIILEPTKKCFAETPKSKVNFACKNQRFACRAGQHQPMEWVGVESWSGMEWNGF